MANLRNGGLTPVKSGVTFFGPTDYS